MRRTTGYLNPYKTFSWCQALLPVILDIHWTPMWYGLLSPPMTEDSNTGDKWNKK